MNTKKHPSRPKVVQPPKPEHAHFFIRDVPTDVHHRAKSEAALRGITLREFVIQALEEQIEQGR